MHLSPAVKVDLKNRFRKELHALPKKICLKGSAMHKEIAKQLIKQQAPHHFEIAEDGEPITLMSLETYTAHFLSVFMEKKQPLNGLFLLHSIPEAELIQYAKQRKIPIIKETKDKIRVFIEDIAKEQPQVWFSLLRSADRLSENLRNLSEKE
ncbi:MAG: hypothetical protein OXR66_07575 [Candidatus Woesearchaeota archaeon]|nr:hypothetical protein [Candidatus Woesearchaeota archaeon]